MTIRKKATAKKTVTAGYAGKRMKRLAANPNAELLVICRHCGSRNIAHGQGFIVLSRVQRFHFDDHSQLAVESFCGLDEIDYDADIGDGMFHCLDCGTEYADGLDENVKAEWVARGAVKPLFGADGETLRSTAAALVIALTQHSAIGRSDEINQAIDTLRTAIGWRDGSSREHLKNRWLVMAVRPFKYSEETFEIMAETAEEAMAAVEARIKDRKNWRVVSAMPVTI